ncbi:hypothetical protein GCM10023235_62700 [Kitasatospora terrestris]|uniref:HTH lysR-type domain-containing protein n=2 Tax=Kitasatospora terrestris TaxID=258051 RepID=A0ABP9EHH9_9ACTN
MDTRLLRYSAAVCEEGQLTAAAARLAGWDEALRATREAANRAGGVLRGGFEGATINLVGRAIVEEFVAIPQEVGHWRDYWLGVEERRGHPVRIGAVAHNADEWLAAVACGQGIGFAPQSMSRLAARPDVAHRPVRGLSASRVGCTGRWTGR